MSKCPYGTQMVSQMPEVVKQVGDSIDLTIDYIADYNKKVFLDIKCLFIYGFILSIFYLFIYLLFFVNIIS